MRFIILIIILSVVVLTQVNCQIWEFPHKLFNSFSWMRQGKTADEKITTLKPPQMNISTRIPSAMKSSKLIESLDKETSQQQELIGGVSTTKIAPTRITSKRTYTTKPARQYITTLSATTNPKTTNTIPFWTNIVLTSQPSITKQKLYSTTIRTTATQTEISTLFDLTTQDVTASTEDQPRDNHRVHDFYINKHEKLQTKIVSNISQNLLPLPAGAGAALVKPTKYHYYPHNQHIYLLPECAIQQVCNAVYVRLNWTQPLCACPSRYRDPCSASLNSDDLHTTELMTGHRRREAITLVKTCEPTADMRICRTPRDWSLLALQNIRTGKSHYLVICRCPDNRILEGPMSHDQPTYASVPGIRVYGMMCVQGPNRKGRPLRPGRAMEYPDFPWKKVKELASIISWD